MWVGYYFFCRDKKKADSLDEADAQELIGSLNTKKDRYMVVESPFKCWPVLRVARNGNAVECIADAQELIGSWQNVL